jgi:hypothetical protein
MSLKNFIIAYSPDSGSGQRQTRQPGDIGSRGQIVVSHKRIRLILSGIILCLTQLNAAFAGSLLHFEVKPSEADPGITRFNDPNEVVFDPESTPDAQLVVFMPGTGGKPSRALQLFDVIAAQGYRVIGLEYNDSPAVVQVCPRDPRPDCSAKFRQKRIFGDDVSNVVDNTPTESIVNRLAKLLLYLDQHDTSGQWSRYLSGSEPNWNRIVLSGLSQGAGMAAFLAKSKAVARVVLFSSPWDFQEPSKALAPWLALPSATPRDRWFAVYHRRENTAALIRRAYEMLQIPAENIRVFDLDVVPEDLAQKKNPFHASTVRVSAYAPEWALLFGRSP